MPKQKKYFFKSRNKCRCDTHLHTPHLSRNAVWPPKIITLMLWQPGLEFKIKKVYERHFAHYITSTSKTSRLDADNRTRLFRLATPQFGTAKLLFSLSSPYKVCVPTFTLALDIYPKSSP